MLRRGHGSCGFSVALNAAQQQVTQLPGAVAELLANRSNPSPGKRPNGRGTEVSSKQLDSREPPSGLTAGCHRERVRPPQPECWVESSRQQASTVRKSGLDLKFGPQNCAFDAPPKQHGQCHRRKNDRPSAGIVCCSSSRLLKARNQSKCSKQQTTCGKHVTCACFCMFLPRHVTLLPP